MQHRTAIVTGAAGTIGAAIVEKLLAENRRVVMVDVNAERLATVASRFPSDLVGAVVVDLAREDAPDRVAESVDPNWAPVSIVVNNAAISPKHNGLAADALNVTMDEWNRVFMINVTAPLLMARRFLPDMQAKKWGRIVNISSRAGRYNPNQAGPAYATTKAAVLGLTRSLANDYASFGITCNSVAPGFVMSEMTGQLTPEILQRLKDGTPVGRGGSATELGSAVAYLASEDAGFITGTCLDVNGGRTMS